MGVDELARLRQSITRHAGDGLTRTPLSGVSVVCSPTTSEPLCGIAEPTLAVVAQGVKADDAERPDVHLRRRAVPGRVGRPAGNRARHPRQRRRAVPRLRARAAPADDRRAAARDAAARDRRTGGRRRHACRHRRQRRITGAAGRARPAARAARRARRRRRAGAGHRARDPVAARHRTAGRDHPPDRAGRQPARAPEPARSAGSAATTTRRCESRNSRPWRR